MVSNAIIEPQLRQRDCPVCDHKGDPTLYKAAKYDPSQLNAFAYASRKPPEYMHHRLVRCRRCDLVYADPAPGPEDLAQAYLGAAYDSQPEARLASRTYGRVVDGIVDRLPCREGVLDIGTGEGSFLSEMMVRRFSKIIGIEPSAEPIVAADPAVRPLIRHAVFEDDVCAEGSLSLITCFQTIEHLHDPLHVFRQAARMLRPGGALLIVAHNRRALSTAVLGERSPIFDVEHLQLFSPRSIRALLRRSGCVDVAVRPLINRYPLKYWARLFPFPRGVRSTVTAALSTGLAGRIEIALPAGNMWAVGFRPVTASSYEPGRESIRHAAVVP